MHRHECNNHIQPIYLILKIKQRLFLILYFLLRKINVDKIFKIMRRFLFNYSFYSHPEIGKFQGVTEAATTVGVPPFAVEVASGGGDGGSRHGHLHRRALDRDDYGWNSIFGNKFTQDF
jgi:hypothetical protein